MDYTYDCFLVRVVDGDTVYLDVDLGFHIRATLDFRLAGLNCPEIDGPTRPAGLAAKTETERLCTLGRLRAVTTKADKYRRWLVRLFVAPATGPELCVNDELLKGGFAVPYMVG